MIARGTVRNTMVVLSLFGLAALTIVVAHFRAPYVPYDEPPELVAKRLDRENNAYYALVDAVAPLPPAPPELGYVKDETGSESEFKLAPDLVAKRLDRENNAYYALVDAVALLPPAPPELGYVKDETGSESEFKLAPGSVGELLSISRPDDDPLLLEYIDKSKPAVERARKALQKPFFTLPPLDWDSESSKNAGRQDWETMFSLRGLCGLLILDAWAQPCSPDPSADACLRLQQAIRFLTDQLSERLVIPLLPSPFATRIIRQACPEHQRAFMQWLKEVRDGWQPPRDRVELALSSIMKYKPPSDPQPHLTRAWWGIPKKVEDQLSSLRQKLFVSRHADLFREAAKLTQHQFAQQRDKFKILEQMPAWPHSLQLHAYSIYTNSIFFATVDGLRIATALEMYRHDHGTYPDLLDSLAPNYLPHVPQSPYDGQQFEYQREGDDYALSCLMRSGSDYPTVSYDGKLVFHIPAGMEAAP